MEPQSSDFDENSVDRMCIKFPIERHQNRFRPVSIILDRLELILVSIDREFNAVLIEATPVKIRALYLHIRSFFMHVRFRARTVGHLTDLGYFLRKETEADHADIQAQPFHRR